MFRLHLEKNDVCAHNRAETYFLLINVFYQSREETKYLDFQVLIALEKSGAIKRRRDVTFTYIWIYEMQNGTWTVTTKPVMEGMAEGRRVEGIVDGVMLGDDEGVLVMKTGSISTVQLSLTAASKAMIEASTSSAFVASTMSSTSA